MPSFYEMGVELGPDATIGAILEYVSPGTTNAKLDEINTAASSLDTDIKGSTARQAFKDGWQTWLSGWQKFYGDNRTGVFSDISKWMTANIYDQALGYQSKLVDWQNAYKSETGQSLSAPGSAVDKPDAGNTLTTSKILFWGGVIVVGGIVVYGIGRSAVARLFD